MGFHGLSRPPSPQLPTFTPPRSGASTPNRYGGNSPPLPSITVAGTNGITGGAVSEKFALSYHSPASHRNGMLKRIARLFTPLRIPIPGSRDSRNAAVPREISIPVLTVLHPSRPLPMMGKQTGKNGPFMASKRRSSHDLTAASNSISALRILIAIIGTILFLVFSIILSLHFVVKPFGRLFKKRSNPWVEPSTLVFETDEIERIWKWEIASGHYPSRRPVDGPLSQVRIENGIITEPVKIENPGLPKRSDEDIRRERQVRLEVQRRLRDQSSNDRSRTSTSNHVELVPVGQGREYISVPLIKGGKSVAYPPRPIVGSVLDMDVVMEHCDFSTKQYVRDCLEVLRVGAGMEMPLRRGNMDAWRTTFKRKYAYSSTSSSSIERSKDSLERHRSDMTTILNASSPTFNSALASRQQLTLALASTSSIKSNRPRRFRPHHSHPTADSACDPDFPHLFHIFWAGPFTDKPYSAALSFLYTQHLGLDQAIGTEPDPNVCRAQLWIWINPGAASSLPDENAVRRMRADLSKNPWSAPLLHRRFEDVVKFKLWNTTEQLDGIEEMKGWREMGLFNSGGVKYGSKFNADQQQQQAQATAQPQKRTPREADEGVQEAAAPTVDTAKQREDKVVAEVEKDVVENLTDDNAVQAEAKLQEAREQEADSTSSTADASDVIAPLPAPAKDELFERVGSTSQKYDRLTVVLSDMARFVLTHRFGGVYLDADTLLLRDWEELWGWHGAFAYRWSRLEKYNTAVLKMQRGSALGNFLFRTAVANDLDFHPMTISRYMKDAGMEGLLLRLPDALFDPAWLNTEYYQRDRPSFPYFQRFEDFFETPSEINAAPNTVGLDGFFKGAYSYHFHNFWWIPFDQSRNFPDLGPRFEAGERLARGRLLAAELAASGMRTPSQTENKKGDNGPSPTLPLVEETRAVPTPTTLAGRRVEEFGPKWGDDETDFDSLDWSQESIDEDSRDLSWSAVVKRTFEAFIRGETPNLYGEWLNWDEVDGSEESGDYDEKR